MTLSDVRDYIESLEIAKCVYMGKLDAKKEKSIGVYNSKHQYPHKKVIGGKKNESYRIKHVTLLIHWNKYQRETEKAAMELFERVESTREIKVNETVIKFIQPLYDIQDVGTDNNGIYEMVIEAAFAYEKGATI